MVKIKIISIGKDKDSWISKGIDHYQKLISKYAQIEFTVIPNIKKSSALDSKTLKAKEAELLSQEIGEKPYTALVDTGQKYDSIEFSHILQEYGRSMNSRICFVIGGAFGLDERLIKNASYTLSLSNLTFSHQLVRLVLLEQIYRGFSILHNTDYHK